MRPRSSTLAIAILTVLLGANVHAEDIDIQAQLVKQGQYWQARANTQRAAEVWQKVLLLNPDQVNALYGMGNIGVKLNKPQQAQEYLARLQALSPIPWQARQLEQDIALAKPENKALLEDARRLADGGDRDKATEVFRQMFNGLIPEGKIGREYYNNLAFNEGGWPEARQGMERLMKEVPDDSILALFYAKQLIRHDSSRAEGARLLAKLTKHVDIAGDADESWRLALVWMGPPKPSQIPLFEEFLKVHPQDQEIRAQMDKGRRQSADGMNPLVSSGLRALEKGDQASAEKAFQERLKEQPNDPDALGGLGVLRQQQNRYAEAEQFLNRAISKGGSQWRTALNSVHYWSLLQQARDMQAKGQTAQAEDIVAQAMRLDPKSIDGRLALADIQAQAGQFDDAMSNYHQVLETQPRNPPAIRGLVAVLSQTGKADEALRLLDSLSPAEQAKFGDQDRLRSLRATQMASLAEQRGDLQGAQQALREAVESDPENVWTRFNLARLYVKTGESQKARNLIDTFIKMHPDNVDALYTSALLSVEMEQWKEAQATINRIPVGRRTASINELSDQITLTMQINLATTLAKSGQHQQALSLLDGLQPIVADHPDRTATLASAYVDAGDSPRALAMMQKLLAQNSAPSANLMLQYASILLRTGDDTQARSVLSSLQNQPLSVATRKRYDDLLYQYRVRQADLLREGGDLASAYDMLAPALVQRPGDVEATSALARMYAANGENAKALELYKPLVKSNPQNTAVLLSAADAAVQSHENAFANTTLDQFVKLQSTDPASLTEAARIYRSMGNAGEATTLLRKAVALEQSQKQRSLASLGVGGSVAVNPFRKQSSNPFSGRRTQPALASTSIIPPSAETVLNNRSALANTTDTYRIQQARISPAVAPDYPLPRMTSIPSVVPVAQRESLTRPSSLQAATAVGDSASPAERALNDILQARSGSVTQGVTIRSNNSESGLSRLTDVETPFEAKLPVGDGRLVLRITPVLLSAGSMSDEAATRFGSAASGSAGVGNQRDEGVGLGLAYVSPDAGVKVDIGTTPIGLKYSTALGGVSIERALEDNPNVRYGVALSRRAVTDSLTSFAGTTDGRDGKSWGGVTANGGRVQLSYDDSDVGVYSYGSLHQLVGHNVKSNTRVELGGGVYRYLQNETDDKLTVGLNATAMAYANNQNFFTYGHGGYFSPQSYFALGIPVTWARRSDRFTYQLKGSVGLQYFQQDATDYFPNDKSLQAVSNQLYAGQSSSGLGYSVEALGEYQFAHKLFVGGSFALDNSRDYREYNVGMYLRYTFEDMKGSPMALPVSPYRSPYSN